MLVTVWSLWDPGGDRIAVGQLLLVLFLPVLLLCVQFVNNAALVGSVVTVVHNRAVTAVWI